MITFKSIGSGDAFASLGNFQSCHLLKFNDTTIMLDCGATVLNSFDQYDEKTNDVDCIFISHFHGDHISGIPFLLLKLFYVHQRKKTLKIIGTSGAEERIRNLMKVMYPGGPEEILNQDFIEFIECNANQVYSIEFGTFEFFPVVHSVPVNPHGIQLKFDNEITFTYSGDTNLCTTIEEKITDSNYMLTECSFNELGVDGHMNVDNILSLHERNPKCKLFLTHCSELISIENQNIELVKQGKLYLLK